MTISYRFRVTWRSAFRILGCTLALIAAAGPGAMVRAQQSGARVSAAAPAPVPDIMLEEIVITAEKRPEKLQDVPVSASVVSTAALRGANVSDISDINNLVPSVNMNGTINGRVPVGMRGISTVSDEQTVGISSGVAILIDGVPVPSDSQGANQIEDVQSIEVLKGPQATLGGRTAAAGVINIVTRGPTDVFQGSIGATATNDHEYRFNGYVSGPISNRVDFSLSGYTAKREFPITNTFYGTKTDQKDYGFRGKLLFKLTDDLDFTLMARHARTISDGYNFVYTYVTPGATLLFPGSSLTQARLFPGITLNDRNLDYNSPVGTAGHRHDNNDFSAIFDLTLGGGYTLTSTTAYQHENQHQVQDLFAVGVYFLDSLVFTGFVPGAPFVAVTSNPQLFNNQQNQWEYIRQTSEELKLVSPADLPFSYVVGAFYSKTSVEETLNRLLDPAYVNITVRPDTSTYDLYGRSTWKFADDMSLVTGLRYNYDALKYSYNQVRQQIATNSFGPFYSADSSNSSALVGDISLQRHFGAHSMAYITYARGYAPKVYDTAAVLYSADQKLKPVAQERINHFELGAKGTYLDGTLRLNAALFDTIYKPYQLQTYKNVPGAASPPLDLVALGQASTKGAEVDLNWAATHLLRLDFSAAYIDAKFNDYPVAPCFPTQTVAQGCRPTTDAAGNINLVQDASGKPMPNSPKFKAITGAEQRIPLGSSHYEVAVGGTYAYRTSAQMLPDQNPHSIQRAFGILNLSAALRDTAGKWSLTAFVNNVTNQVYYADVEDFFFGPWASNAVIAQPARDAQRYAGVRFTMDFN
jgi:iron complex outermembrane receptor protein